MTPETAPQIIKAWIAVAHEVAPYLVALVLYVIAEIKIAKARAKARDAKETATGAVMEAALAKQQADGLHERQNRQGESLAGLNDKIVGIARELPPNAKG